MTSTCFLGPSRSILNRRPRNRPGPGGEGRGGRPGARAAQGQQERRGPAPPQLINANMSSGEGTQKKRKGPQSSLHVRRGKGTARSKGPKPRVEVKRSKWQREADRREFCHQAPQHCGGKPTAWCGPGVGVMKGTFLGKETLEWELLHGKVTFTRSSSPETKWGDKNEYLFSAFQSGRLSRVHHLAGSPAQPWGMGVLAVSFLTWPAAVMPHACPAGVLIH